jgi:hypothetical protein
MVAVVFHFLCHDGLLFVFERIALTVGSRLAGICCSVSALASGLAVQRSASAAAAFADIQGDFIPELHWLEIAFGAA